MDWQALKFWKWRKKIHMPSAASVITYTAIEEQVRAARELCLANMETTVRVMRVWLEDED